VQETLRHHELIAIHIARQSDLPISTLVAINLRASESGAFAALTAKSQIQVNSGQDDLIGWRGWIAANKDAHRLNAGETRDVLLRYALAPLFGKAGIHQVRENASLLAAETERDGSAATRHTPVMILPERVIVWNARVGALRVIETDVEAPG